MTALTNYRNTLLLIRARQWRNGELIELVDKALRGTLTRNDFPLKDEDLVKLGIIWEEPCNE